MTAETALSRMPVEYIAAACGPMALSTSGQGGYDIEMDGIDFGNAFFEQCPAMAAVVGDDGRILRANAALAGALELSETELQAMTIADLSGHGEREMKAWLRALREPGQKLSLTFRAPPRNSGPRWLCFQLSRSLDGKLVFLVATDVTAWKDDDEARDKREGRLRAIIRHLPLAFMEFGLDGKVITWNPAAERTFGYGEAEILGKSHIESISPQVTKSGEDNHLRELSEAGHSHMVATNTTKDGRKIRCEWSLVLIRDESGKGSSVACLARDITDKERVEQELLRSQTLLRTVLDNVPLVLWAMSPDSVYTFIDGAGLKTLGATPEQLIGQNPLELFQDVPGFPEMGARLFAGDTSPAIFSTGNATWEAHSALRKGEDGEMIELVGVTLDVTERARTEQELRQRLELIEEQKSAMRAMAIPILQVWDDVLAVPVIGVVDAARAAELMASLLHAVTAVRATHVIIDLTGVEAVDTSTADHLLKLVQALSLLGARAVVSGIKPSVAGIIVSLGARLSDVTTVRNLREAIRWCAREMPGVAAE